MKKVFSIVLAMAMCLGLMSGCGEPAAPSQGSTPSQSAGSNGPEASPASPLGTVRYAIHPGSSAFAAGFLLKELKYNEKYNFEVDLMVTPGPNVYSALAAGELDIGYLGNGMGWHYFEDGSKIAILTIDNLTDDDRLLMRTGLGFTENETLETLAEKLPGKTIACDLTTTPGTFLRALVNAINKDKADADKLWYEDVEGAYPVKGSEDKQIVILNTTNANITAAMQDRSVDGCITFSNVRIALQRDTDNYVQAATTSRHLADNLTPSTWAVNKDFATAHPELVQAFMNALMDAMDYRHDEANWDKCIELAIPFDQLSIEDYNPDAAYWPSKADLGSYFATDDSIGFTYLEQIRASHMGTNGLDAATAPQARDVIMVDFLRNATAG